MVLWPPIDWIYLFIRRAESCQKEAWPCRWGEVIPLKPCFSLYLSSLRSVLEARNTSATLPSGGHWFDHIYIQAGWWTSVCHPETILTHEYIFQAFQIVIFHFRTELPAVAVPVRVYTCGWDRETNGEREKHFLSCLI